MTRSIKTSELSGAALDWAAARCEGCTWIHAENFLAYWEEDGEMHYSTNWEHGGPIIEREGINLFQRKGAAAKEGKAWLAYDNKNPEMAGPTPLIAAMRCYVASELGDTLAIPMELINYV